MKKLTALLLALLLILPAALADFDLSSLREDANLLAIPQYGTVNTILRPLDQPFAGQADTPDDAELVAYVDFIHLVDEEVTLLRLMVSTVVFDYPLGAEQVRVSVGGKHYTLDVTREESEYDGLYMEDYSTCLTEASLPLLKAIAQQKKDAPIPVALLCSGETVLSGLLTIPGDAAAQLYDRFISLGGKTQPLKQLDAKWPCTVVAAK